MSDALRLYVPVFFYNDPATTDIYTLSLHDALPISFAAPPDRREPPERHRRPGAGQHRTRSEEHTSELQSRPHLVCRLLLEKKKCGLIRTYDKILTTV